LADGSFVGASERLGSWLEPSIRFGGCTPAARGVRPDAVEQKLELKLNVPVPEMLIQKGFLKHRNQSSSSKAPDLRRDYSKKTPTRLSPFTILRAQPQAHRTACVATARGQGASCVGVGVRSPFSPPSVPRARRVYNFGKRVGFSRIGDFIIAKGRHNAPLYRAQGHAGRGLRLVHGGGALQ
jgi:hypothetical protein